MSTWLGQRRIAVESFVLRGTEVSDLEDFADHHDRYLVSILDQPTTAARLWHEQARKIHPAEGWISLTIDGEQVMPLAQWTNIQSFWFSMLDVIEQYMAVGQGMDHFSDSSGTFGLCQRGRIALFEIAGTRIPVEPTLFIDSMLLGAEDFYAWAIEYVGSFDNSYSEHIDRLRAALGSTRWL